MKKKGIIICCVCVVVVALIVALVVGLVGAKSPKKVAKDFAKALRSEENLEKFLDKNIDFKANAAMSAVDDNADIANVKSYDEYKEKTVEAFEKAYKEVDKDAIEKAKEDVTGEEGLASYKDYIKDDMKFSKANDLEDCKAFPMFKQMDVTYKSGEDEVELSLLFYKKKLVAFMPTDSLAQISAFMDIMFQMQQNGGSGE